MNALMSPQQRTPYALYIHLNEYENIWGNDSHTFMRALYCAELLLQQNARMNESDPRPYLDKEKKRSIFKETLRAFVQDTTCLRKLMHWPALSDADKQNIEAKMAVLRAENKYGQEDTLFASVHLIAESWFAVVHDILKKCYDQPSSPQTADSLKLVARIIEAQQQFVQILEYMSHRDYHRLRVNLRDASGAQSRRIHEVPALARKVFEGFWAQLKKIGVPPLMVLDNQHEHVGLYRLLSAFQDLTRSFQAFLFNHYLMVGKILGASSLGSLGAQVNGLVGHAANSIFPELDQLFFDYTQITNFRYGHMSGKIVMEKELQWQVADYRPYEASHELDAARVKEVIAQYFRCIETQDIRGWVQLFHPEEGQMCDAPGSRPFKGSQKLAIFMKNFFKAFQSVAPQILDLTIEKNTAICHWKMNARTYNDTLLSFSGVETFRLNPHYQIMYALADYDAEALAADLLMGTAGIDYPKPVQFEMYH